MPRGIDSSREAGSTQRKGPPREASWIVLGASWRSRAPLSVLAVSESFFGPRGVSWEPLGGLWGACWGLLGPPGRLSGPS
eukprot:116665-Pyramimonas_sp.AAC.1